MTLPRWEPPPLGPVCGIPNHPVEAHGGHPGCILHGDMRYHDGWWSCPGWDGEGCKLNPVALRDHYSRGPHARNGSPALGGTPPTR